ncbi:tumor protein p53-inducible nuclear protein 1 [Pseudophryne corroboree]|uniref:tumor protein p53-inducible nuclear protein 1 n=1 Tax=Pseudophryne corroboree TaxID=495146 RepID=UPI0030820C2B
MFQKLNSLFMGDARSRLSEEPELSEKEDDEWILVDFIVDTCPRTPEEASAFEEINYVDENPDLSYTPGAFEQFGNTIDSFFVHFDPCPLEESWFVTPPPCFTAGELTTIEVQTNPLENLLIEHPSMSVYAVRNVANKQIATCDSDFRSSSSLGLDTERKKVGQRVHCYVASLAARTNCLDQTKTFRCTKLSKRLLEKPLLNRKSLRRQNLIRGCHSRPIKHNGLLVHQPCQRRYNY